MPKFYTVPVPRGLRQKLGLQGSDIRTGFLQLRFMSCNCAARCSPVEVRQATC
jgi:hypothetical protein